jgi:membrane protease subunit HflK
MMLDKLFDWIDRGWDRLRPFTIVDAWEKGVVLRWGKFHRALEPGFHWKWPLAERVVEITAVETTMRLLPQTLTTKDGVGVVATSVVRYEIKDVEKYTIRIFDAKDVLGDTTMGAVRRVVSTTDYADLMQGSTPEDTVSKAVRSDVTQYGFKVHRVTFIDLAKVRSIRLIQADPMANLDN